jgi:hypothetical protein
MPCRKHAYDMLARASETSMRLVAACHSPGVLSGMRTQAFLKDPELPDEELFQLLPAPDFPGGGEIMGLKGARDMYLTGRGSIVVRAKAHTEVLKNARGTPRPAIIVTELPQSVAKNVLLERIAELVNDKKVDGEGRIASSNPERSPSWEKLCPWTKQLLLLSQLHSSRRNR